MQQPAEVSPDPVQAELSKRLDRIETHHREDNTQLRQDMQQEMIALRQEMREDNTQLRQDMQQEIIALRQEMTQRIDALNGRIYWVIGTQIALMALLFAGLKLT